MRLKGGSYFPIFILLLMMVVMAKLLPSPHFEVKFMPITLASIISALALVELWRELRGKVKDPTDTEEKPEGKAWSGVERRRFGTVMAWIIAYGLTVYLVGLIAASAFCFFYLKFHGKSWLTAIGYAVVMAGILYATFELAFDFDLYRGLNHPYFIWEG